MLVESLSRLLAAAMTMPESGDLDRPHIVVTIDPVTGVMAAFGPFADGIGALGVANRLQSELNALGDGLPPVRAIPLPLDMPETDPGSEQPSTSEPAAPAFEPSAN